MNVETMPAGREMDGWVHVLIFGQQVETRWCCLNPEDGSYFEVQELYVDAQNDLIRPLDWPRGYEQHPCYLEDGMYWRAVPFYSTDIAAAWQVVETMRARGWYSTHTDLTLDTGSEWWSWHFADHTPPGNHSVSATAETVPLVICRASLLSVGVTQ